MNDALELNQNQKATYDQLCISYRAIDDFRAKLLGFLPLATGGGIFLLLSSQPSAGAGVLPAGRAVRACDHARAVRLRDLRNPQVSRAHRGGRRAGEGPRPHGRTVPGSSPCVFGLINEPFAASVIYPAVLAAWGYFALVFVDRLAAAAVAGVLFVGGLTFTL